MFSTLTEFICRVYDEFPKIKKFPAVLDNMIYDSMFNLPWLIKSIKEATEEEFKEEFYKVKKTNF